MSVVLTFRRSMRRPGGQVPTRHLPQGSRGQIILFPGIQRQRQSEDESSSTALPDETPQRGDN